MAEEVEVAGVWGYVTSAVSSGTFKVFLSEPVYDESYDEEYAEQIMTD